MRAERAGAKFRVELARDKIRVILAFYDFGQYAFVPGGHFSPRVAELFDVLRVKLVAVAMAFHDLVLAV